MLGNGKDFVGVAYDGARSRNAQIAQRPERAGERGESEPARSPSYDAQGNRIRIAPRGERRSESGYIEIAPDRLAT